MARREPVASKISPRGATIARSLVHCEVALSCKSFPLIICTTNSRTKSAQKRKATTMLKASNLFLNEWSENKFCKGYPPNNPDKKLQMRSNQLDSFLSSSGLRSSDGNVSISSAVLFPESTDAMFLRRFARLTEYVLCAA